MTRRYLYLFPLFVAALALFITGGVIALQTTNPEIFAGTPQLRQTAFAPSSIIFIWLPLTAICVWGLIGYVRNPAKN